MKKVVDLSEVEACRERKLWPQGREYDRTVSLMKVARYSKLGKRPVGGSLNRDLLARSPGSSRNTGLDFVKAVYAAKTGQEG